jgi:hypothetical protein
MQPEGGIQPLGGRLDLLAAQPAGAGNSSTITPARIASREITKVPNINRVFV